jgi:hypothetical protein
MRPILILAGIPALIAAGWTMPLEARASGHWSGHGSGHGSTHGSHGQDGLEGSARHRGGHTEHMGILFPTLLELQWFFFPGEPQAGPAAPEITMSVAPTEHRVAGHPYPTGSVGHAHTAVAAQIRQGAALASQSTVPSGAVESDETGAATAQPNLAATPFSPRPPGAAGPGRPSQGWSGPGLPGPGRRAIPRFY